MAHVIPKDLPPWRTVQQQTQRWRRAGWFEAMMEDLRTLLRLAARPSATACRAQPSSGSRTLQNSPESGE